MDCNYLVFEGGKRFVRSFGNGARIDRLNIRVNEPAKGCRKSHDVLVNYPYELKVVEASHEALVKEALVDCSTEIRAMLSDSSKMAERITAWSFS